MDKLFATLSKFSRRDQTIMIFGALIVFLYILWIALISPLQGKRDRLLETNVATQQSLGRVQLLAGQIQSQGQAAQTGGDGGNISGLIDTTLRDNGMSMSGFQPGAGGEVRVRIDKTSSQALLQWLYDLEVKNQVGIRELSITASTDPGQVAVNVRLLKN